VGRGLAPDYWTALGLAVFSGFGITGLALAMVNDIIASMPDSEKANASRILAVERTGWSMGIILGPAIAAAIVTAAGDTRPVFAVAALIQVVAIVMVSRVRSGAGVGPIAHGPSNSAGATPVKAMRTPILIVLFASFVLLALPAQTRTVYMPLFVTTILGEPAGRVGPLFTITAVIVVLTMPYVGTAAARFGAQRLLYVSAFLGAGYCLLQSASSTYLQTAAAQLIVGLGIAMWNTSTLIYLQEAMPGRAGSAGGLYVAVQQVTPLLAGLLLGPIAESAGIPAAFTTTALLCMVAVALLARGHRALVRQ
jgi:SET family sugar efflux transporter-like MFS transporter